MKAMEEIQRVIDQLIYNKSYAPNYPEEDQTNTEREQHLIVLWLDSAIALVNREDVGDWLRLGRSSVEEAFTKVRDGDRSGSVRAFQFAVQYLRNALAGKPYKVDFIGKPGGPIIVVPPSGGDEAKE